MLQISSLGGAPVLNPVPDATWGLHLVDANIALGDAVRLLKQQTKAYRSRGLTAPVGSPVSSIVTPKPECRHCRAVLPHRLEQVPAVREALVGESLLSGIGQRELTSSVPVDRAGRGMVGRTLREERMSASVLSRNGNRVGSG